MTLSQLLVVTGPSLFTYKLEARVKALAMLEGSTGQECPAGAAAPHGPQQEAGSELQLV